jgi:flagellar biosynthesis protein FlhA
LIKSGEIMAESGQGILKSIKADAADVAMIVAIVGILIAMIIPLPPFMLDFLLALNITLGIIILITTMYTEKPLEFSVFPSVLLMLTLFRLSLNVASTRLILLRGNEGEGAAGAVIQSFGRFVVGGDYIVGMIIFVILVLINFIVITKGAGRIAEVAARFTLDAMPGKQMAIDADLNAGIIDENEARDRREVIRRESEFHGAMDGASKFVRGDAVAGIIITIINIIGGLIIGMMKGMPLADAAQNYTILTVGDGLVSQIPALVISTAAGLLVSRGGADGKLGGDLYKLLSSKTTPIYIGSAIVFMLGLVPGLPTVPFVTLGILLGVAAFFISRTIGQKLEEESKEEKEAEEAPAGPEEVDELLSMDLMELEVGYGLIPLVDASEPGNILERIRSIRRQFATEMGIVVPPIHIRDNLKLNSSEYRFLIKGVEAAKFEIMPDHFLAMDPGDVIQKVSGIPTIEPAFGLDAIWIPKEREEDAKLAGYTVVDPSTVMATHLTEVIRNNAFELLGRQEVQYLLDNLSKSSPKAVEELVPSLMSLGMVQKVLQNLLSERVSIRDLLSIVETLADYATMTKDPDILTEYVRQKLSRSILSQYLTPDGNLNVIVLDRKVEELLNNSIQKTEHGSYLAMEPKMAEQIISSIKNKAEEVLNANIQPIVLCSPNVRRHLRKLTEQYIPSAVIISYAEVPQNISLKTIGKAEI